MAWHLSCTWLSNLHRPDGEIYKVSMYDGSWAVEADARPVVAELLRGIHAGHWKKTVVPGRCWLVSTSPASVRPESDRRIYIYRLVWVKP